jgi:hypothetical protein
LLKNEQQKQKAEQEYTARYMIEQKLLSIEQILNMKEQKAEEAARKYNYEIESVSLFKTNHSIDFLKIL